MVPSAVLPNPAEPSVVAFGALVGAFVGHTVGWALGDDHDTRVRRSVNGSYVGTAIALTAYVLSTVRGAGII